MIKKFLELVIGDFEEKKKYRVLQKRVAAFPKEYRFVYKQIETYMHTVASPQYDPSIYMDGSLFISLIDLFEEGIANHTSVYDLVGTDVKAFADDLMQAVSSRGVGSRERLNQEIQEYFAKEEVGHVE
ncbi:MAG: DUF1048 domain-containing protein [Erysipelotrichaceae bacterium]